LVNQITVVQIQPSQNIDHRFELVLEAVERLKPLDREALRLVLWDELSHAEASVVMNCSINAFELRYRRARNSVRRTVEDLPPLVTRPESSSLAKGALFSKGQTP
jgi:DNA-directed RNA polymerase specialized sigma24 family protein